MFSLNPTLEPLPDYQMWVLDYSDVLSRGRQCGCSELEGASWLDRRNKCKPQSQCLIDLNFGAVQGAMLG